MADTSTALELGNGTVTVTVVCEEQEYTAGVSDTAAVVRAGLTPAQLQSVAAGENMEIRVEVKDISGNVPKYVSATVKQEMRDFTVALFISNLYAESLSFIKNSVVLPWNTIL